MSKNILQHIFFSCLLTMLLAGCRDDAEVIWPQQYDTAPAVSAYKGLYLLCEGNMGSNKATLDYLDISTGAYSRNIYPSRNPSLVMELGDVGNDIKAYGSRLWMVINQSNKVEVANVRTARHIGQVNVPNARFLAFDAGYAYVSSYVGPINGRSVLGEVYKIDTTTLQIVARCTVGYQPEEMVVSNGRLYVVNSGGYNVMQGMDYDHTVSVIDLSSFSVIKTVNVAPNLFRIRKDAYGDLWVASRGDNNQQPSRLYDLYNDQVTDSVNVPANDFTFRGDSLVYLSSQGCGIIDLKTHRVVNRSFLQLPDGEHIKTPYGIISDPSSGLFYVMDATNYVSSGRLLCFDANGRYLWSQWTGDIPGHACLVKDTQDVPSTFPDESRSDYIQAVDEYLPAPGQFVNLLPRMDSDDNPDSACIKCTQILAGSMNGLVTLGGFGGYITFHFDRPVRNIPGKPDLLIRGNAHAGGSEPGIVMVAQDSNHNGKPDDEWYELMGSADEDSTEAITYHYAVTYQPAPMQDIPWTDNQGKSGTIRRNSYHSQEYFPLWISGPITLRGTLLPANGHNRGTGRTDYWVLDSFRFGYVDNVADDEGCSFDIEWAVNDKQQPVHLSSIDFVRVYSAENQQCGWLGETSTEIMGAKIINQ